jgi:CRISPR-associated protein Cas1
MERGCFVVTDQHGNKERYPLFENEIGEVVLKSGNAVSTGALAALGFWDIDVMIMTQKGRPVAMLKSLDDDAHVKTRLCQYEAVSNEKGRYLAKQFVLGKYHGQNSILKKYDLEPHDPKYISLLKNCEADDLRTFRRRLMAYESKFTKKYFDQLFTLFPEFLRPKGRRTFKAYDGLNNLFNLGYELLAWKVHRALSKAHLEPYLGFLHSTQHGKPSLVCDVQEMYRHYIEDFLIQNCQDLTKKDFVVKTEPLSRTKQGQRVYLNDTHARVMMKQLNAFFEMYVVAPRMQGGNQQTLATFINEKMVVIAQFLREDGERKKSVPHPLFRSPQFPVTVVGPAQ